MAGRKDDHILHKLGAVSAEVSGNEAEEAEVTGLAIKDQEQVARPLKILVPLIQRDIEQGREAERRAGLPYFQAAGEKLIEAKSQVTHGDWDGWVKRNFGVTRQTAANWMRLSRTIKDQMESAHSFSTLSEFTNPNRESHHRPTWHEPIREVIKTVDVDRMAQERQAKEREARLERELALKLIDIGYKVLATQLHPDKGGSTEAMHRLQRVRTLLKSAV